MPELINVYCTHRSPASINFPHLLHNRRDRRDPEMASHLAGFMGYIMEGGRAEMTQTRFHVLQHLRRVQHQFSLDVREQDMAAFSVWAQAANAICFLTDGTVRDPNGNILVAPGQRLPDPKAEVPYPPDALSRKDRISAELQHLGISVVGSLPPVISEVEVEIRSAAEVQSRALALFVVALCAESFQRGTPIPIRELQERLPTAFKAITHEERAFLMTEAPDEQVLVNMLWRYESLTLLLWSLGLLDTLPFPTEICDVPLVARTVFNSDMNPPFEKYSMRSTAEILDSVDYHYRIHWVVRQAGLEEKEPPANLEGGVIQERHHALNWLVCYNDDDWDDIDTPT